MVKKLLTIILGLTLAAGASAQWGGNGNYPYPASNIQFWTGSGSNSAVVVISWDDEDASYAPQGFAWGVHFNGAISAHNLLDTIAAYDPRFTFSFSSTLLSTIAYHDAANNVHLTPSIQYNCFNVNGTFAPDVYDNITISDGDMMEISESCYFDCTNVTPATVPGGSTPGTDTTATGCTPLVLDGTNSFLETFDTLGTTGNGVVPACWSTTHIAGSATALWTSYSASATSCHSGTRMMQLPDMQSGNITLLVAPAFSIANANQYQVSLWVKRTSSYSNKQNEGVKVWANSTPDTVGGTVLFHARRSITQTPAVSTEGWYEYTGVIPLTGTVYIVMEGISEYGASTYIDDFSVSRAPNCDDPTDLAFDPAASLVSWTAGNATQWQVRDGETLSVVNTPSYTNPAWQLATNYTVSVRSICGTGDTNAWQPAITFTTPRAACLDTTPLPYTTTFDGYDYELSPYYAGAPLPDCWTIYSNGTNRPEEGSSASIYYSGIGIATSMNNYGCVTVNDPYFAFMAYAPYDGTYTTYTNNMNAYGTRKFAVLPRFAQPVDQLQLGFDYSMNSTSGAELRIGYITTDTTDFTALYTVPNAYRTRTHAEVDFAALSSAIPAAARIAMLWLTTDTVHTGSAPANHFCGIDNVEVTPAPSCKYPRNLTVDSIGYHEFGISWSEVSTTPATQWEVLYGAQGFDPTTAGTSATAASTSTMVSGLTADTYYDVYVRSLCGTQYSEWAGPVTVRTRCPHGGNVILGAESLDNYTVAFANWGNTMCQSIFTAAELGEAGLHAGDTIGNLVYDWHSGTTARYTKAFQIYMTHSDSSAYPATVQATSWLPVTAADLVLGDSLTTTAAGSTRYDLTTPFVWNGTSSIVVTTFVSQPDGADHSSSGVYAASSNAGARRTLYARQDHTAYTLTNLTTTSPNATTYRANIVIERPCIDTLGTTPDTTAPALPDTVDATIAFSDILYWVGSGSDSAALIVNYAQPDTAFAWGYLFNGSTTAQAMVDAIAAADPRFWINGNPSLNGDIHFLLENGDTLGLSAVDPAVGYNFWWTNLNGVSAAAGASSTLHNGDVFKYGDMNSATGWDYMYGYYMEEAWNTVPTPVTVPDTATTDTTTVAEATIAASDILYWVGTGSNQAILAVNWADTALAWGYRFSGSATVADMMNDIAAADPRFSYSGTGFLDDITFNDGTVSLAGTPGNYWGSTNNGIVDAGLVQALANGDLEKWGDPAAGVVVDSMEWGGVYYYTYAYPMTIHPVSVPDTTTPVDTTVVEATIATSDILYWVGTGSNQAILAVNWADTALAWGYRFSGSATVADMMADIAAADPRFSYSGTGFLDDIFYIDTAAGMTDTLHITPGNYWGSTNNGISDMGMGQTLANGDLEKWADPAAGVIVDSASYEYGGETYWYYIYAYPMTIHPVTVPDTTGQGGPVVPEHGPFCGAVGTEGCDAIYTDSSAIVAWATGITVERGPVDITDPDGPRVHFGTDEMGLGAAGTSTTHAVSLGDGGIATLTFARPIANGDGPDFAVFENSWGDYFLELAFVEVSSDGERFVRFPATSLTPTDVQVGSNGFVDPTFINNLAGKYRVGYGTPFDLEELADSTGLDITRITHVRLIDVVGSIDPQYATYDAFGHMVNDPWPTNDTVYGSGGFDLTGVAVLHENTTGIDDIATSNISVWPNPATDMLNIVSTGADKARLMDINGRTVETYVLRDGRTSVSISHLPAGVYMLQIGSTVSKIVKF